MHKWVQASSAAEQKLVAEFPGFIKFVLAQLLCDPAPPEPQLQVFFDLLAELLKFNPPLLFAVQEQLESGPEGAQRTLQLTERLSSHIVDASIFVQCVALTLNSDTSPRRGCRALMDLGLMSEAAVAADPPTPASSAAVGTTEPTQATPQSTAADTADETGALGGVNTVMEVGVPPLAEPPAAAGAAVEAAAGAAVEAAAGAVAGVAVEVATGAAAMQKPASALPTDCVVVKSVGLGTSVVGTSDVDMASGSSHETISSCPPLNLTDGGSRVYCCDHTNCRHLQKCGLVCGDASASELEVVSPPDSRSDSTLQALRSLEPLPLPPPAPASVISAAAAGPIARYIRDHEVELTLRLMGTVQVA